MVSIYLWVNSALYLIFAAWMTLLPERTGKSLGYLALNNSGQSEFLVIYGGLQLGLAAFFGWCAHRESLHGTGLIFALMLYAPIVLYRGVTLVRFSPVERTTLAVAALELVLLIAAAALVLHKRKGF